MDYFQCASHPGRYLLLDPPIVHAEVRQDLPSVSCMLSEEMFDRHLVPILEQQGAHLDHAIYHLDGPGAIRHVLSITSIQSINAMNWIAGEGQGPMSQWADLIKDMQDRGKPVQCSARPEDIEPILEKASPRGLLLHVRCASQQEGDDVVRKAEQWTAKYDKPFKKR